MKTKLKHQMGIFVLVIIFTKFKIKKSYPNEARLNLPAVPGPGLPAVQLEEDPVLGHEGDEVVLHGLVQVRGLKRDICWSNSQVCSFAYSGLSLTSDLVVGLGDVLAVLQLERPLLGAAVLGLLQEPAELGVGGHVDAVPVVGHGVEEGHGPAGVADGLLHVEEVLGHGVRGLGLDLLVDGRALVVVLGKREVALGGKVEF